MHPAQQAICSLKLRSDPDMTMFIKQPKGSQFFCDMRLQANVAPHAVQCIMRWQCVAGKLQVVAEVHGECQEEQVKSIPATFDADVQAFDCERNISDTRLLPHFKAFWQS